MRLETRKLLDRAFSGLGLLSILVMAAAVIIILAPIVSKGLGAYFFRGTVDFRRMQLEQFDVGDPDKVAADVALATQARAPIYEAIETFKADLKKMPFKERGPYKKALKETEEALELLLGPAPGDRLPALPRQRYGQTRWDRTHIALDSVLFRSKWVYPDPTQPGVIEKTDRKEIFAGTSLEPMFSYLEEHLDEIMRPRPVFYTGFLTQESKDAHFFGGIWPEVLGTLMLTLGAMLFAVPMGVIAAIYLCEYAPDNYVISLLRTCISTLAGVPSIVFGLFGLAFLLNNDFFHHLNLFESKCALAGSVTLSLLVLPTVIRASEEAILSVPRAYKEASMGLGAGKWHTIVKVILPAALPGILTGVVISMGRAAGETAPIIFTAAVSVGRPLTLGGFFTEPTPALPWNIYNLCSEHEAVDQIRHVQYGMVFTLVALVLILNLLAIVMRARISKKLKG